MASGWTSMSGKYLLDTNIAIRILNHEIDLEARRGGDFEAFLSVTVVGELLFGTEKSSKGRDEPQPDHTNRLAQGSVKADSG